MSTTALQNTGERQLGVNLESIREDHRERYLWARDRIATGARVIDAGCGVGYGSHILAEKAATIWSLDVDQDAIEYAKRYWCHERISHEVQDLHFFTPPDNTIFDAVIAFEMVEHLIEPRLFLSRTHMALAETGRLFVSVPNEKVIPHSVALNPFHIRHYTVKEITELLVECGYAVEGVYSQDTAKVVRDANGQFLIIEAVRNLKSCNKANDKYSRDLLHSAISSASNFIVQRAVSLQKSKNDIKSLKARLDELNKKLSVSDSTTNTSEKNRNEIESLVTRVSQLEVGVNADLRQRAFLLESSERTTRNALIAAQFKSVRIELQVQSMRGQVRQLKQIKKYYEELASTQTSRLKQALAELEEKHLAALCTKEDMQHKQAALADAHSRINDLHAAMSAQQTALADKEQICEALGLEVENKERNLEKARSTIAELEHRSTSLAVQLKKIKENELKLGEQLRACQAARKAVTSSSDASMLNDAKITLEKLKQSTIRLLAIMAENEALTKANEYLALELEKAMQRTVIANGETEISKAPPTLGYIWGKLKYHRFYVPFLIKALRNSLGLKRSRRTVKVVRS